MRRQGYIFAETVVAMALLSMSALVIQGALRQAIITRGQAQDFNTARFLMEQIASENALQFQQPEGSGSGVFDPPFDRFSYEWELKRVEVPLPPIPPFLPPEVVANVMQNFKDYMGKLTVRIRWNRAGMDVDRVGETLVRPDLLWQPPPPELEPLP
jgi:hypothetical protein